ncbi:MAG: 2'-5' RNA ligase family protein [Dermatophilaceae bacterium]
MSATTSSAVAELTTKLDPITSTFQRAVIFREAIALPPSNPDAYAYLRHEIRAGITDAWGWCPENPDAFRAHTSAAYGNDHADATPIRHALDMAEPTSPVSATYGQASLIRMHRDRRMYEWDTVTEAHLHE